MSEAQERVKRNDDMIREMSEKIAQLRDSDSEFALEKAMYLWTERNKLIRENNTLKSVTEGGDSGE